MRKGPSIVGIRILSVVILCFVAHAQDIFVVANETVSISQISDSELLDLFTGSRSRFRDGSRAVPVILKGGPAHEVFLHKHIGHTSDSFRTLWRKAVFTGQGAAPKELSSEEALLEYIAATPGAIGYVSHLRAAERVKVVTISGKAVLDRSQTDNSLPENSPRPTR